MGLCGSIQYTFNVYDIPLTRLLHIGTVNKDEGFNHGFFSVPTWSMGLFFGVIAALQKKSLCEEGSENYYDPSIL